MGIEQDVTEKALTTQTLDVLNRVLRHNLRNALTVINGHADMLNDEGLDPEARQASVAAIKDQAGSMQKIAEKTAEIRSIWDPGDTQQTWKQLDIVSLVETYQRQYPDVDITCTGEFDGEIAVRGGELFKIAMDEAVENAIVHTDQSPPEVKITIHQDLDANQLRISVADNGPGIPAIERQTIESGEETKLMHSLGIGLWLMEWITTLLGGELTIEDNEPRGNRVVFQLPLPVGP